jgi:DNA modification methylase
LPNTSKSLPSEIRVQRSDAIYMAHGYPTKVPISAIVPFIEAFTQPGDTVADPFAGSGMTGIAAYMLGRHGILSDISRLGSHVGSNYVNLVDPEELLNGSKYVVNCAQARTKGLYETVCSHCGGVAVLVKAIWSQVYLCDCGSEVVYYRALEASNWSSPIKCPQCGLDFKRRTSKHISSQLVKESVKCSLLRVQLEQNPLSKPPRYPELEHWPDVEIGPDREMYRRSGLSKHGMTTTSSFFSVRNLTALVALQESITLVADDRIRRKLLFAFTAILPRASKRYQWSRNRPLNAQNQTYYIAPVFYEWNVFDLFERKVRAIIASDSEIRRSKTLFNTQGSVSYTVASADDLHHIPSESVDYIFTDPPFGSNIFYSDMSLFQEVWLGDFTDVTKEAVIATSVKNGATASRYEALLTGALNECRRVLKPGAYLSMVFSNSRGEVWAMAQRALRKSGLMLVPELLSSINKGQRSVKGLASGFEGVVTCDLVFTVMKDAESHAPSLLSLPEESVEDSVGTVLKASLRTHQEPSDVYLSVVRRYLAHHWTLEELQFEGVLAALQAHGHSIHKKSGKLVSSS